MPFRLSGLRRSTSSTSCAPRRFGDRRAARPLNFVAAAGCLTQHPDYQGGMLTSIGATQQDFALPHGGSIWVTPADRLASAAPTAAQPHVHAHTSVSVNPTWPSSLSSKSFAGHFGRN